MDPRTKSLAVLVWIFTAFATALGGCREDSDGSQAPSDPVEWMAHHAIPVASVHPQDRDFSDLQPLKEIIGEARVVLLGEQSHGDGTVFLTKTRLIEFLHEEMDFDVLAFESGLFDMRKAWEAMAEGQDPRMAFSRGVFGIWSESAQLQPLISYLGEVAAGARPLELAGFDSQFTAAGSRDALLPDLEGFLEAGGCPLLSDDRWPDFTDVLKGLVDGTHYTEKPSEEERDLFRGAMADLREWVGEASERTGPDGPFWAQMLKSIAAQAEGTWILDSQDLTVEATSFRDEQMADNLLWLANEWYPDRKVIVWAATFHNVRNIREIDTRMPEFSYDRAMTMGHRVWEVLGEESYNLGFTAFEGEAAPWRADSAQLLQPPSEGSLEDLMARAGLENAIIDFRSAGSAMGWLSKPMLARPLGYAEMEADWTRVLDGLFFNRVMERSTRAGPPPR